MGNFSIFSKKVTVEKSLIIDVGSSSVTASFVEFGEGHPTIVSLVKSDIEILKEISFSRFESEMFKALNRSLSDLNSKQKFSPDKVEVYLASPWYASQVRVARMSRPKPFVISKNMLNDMVTKEIRAFGEEEISGKTGSKESLRMIESATLKVVLDGTIKDNPMNSSARELEIFIFLAVASEQVLKKIEESIAHTYGHRKIKFSTFGLSSFIVTRDFFPHQSSYLLLDIGGEVTDISVVKNDALVKSVFFPKGHNFLLRRMSRELNRSIADSFTLCMLHHEGKVANSLKGNCERILSSAKKEWLSDFNKKISEISKEYKLPNAMFFTVDQNAGLWFSDVVPKNNFNVVELDPTFFHKNLKFNDGVSRNSFIMIEALSSARSKKI